MKNLSDKVRCLKKKKIVTLEKCLNAYVEATAFNKFNSDCYNCPFGRDRRERFSCPLSTINIEDQIPRNQQRKKFRRFDD